jgi:phenylacetate-CoA ligase
MATERLTVLSARALESPYWNEYTETLPRERLDALHLQKLRALLHFAYERSAFYRKKFDDAGIKPGDIRTLDDFKYKVPTTDKNEFLHLQQQYPPYGKTVTLPIELVSFHGETSGTTGFPLAIPLSQYDIERYAESWCHGAWAHGIRPGHGMYFAFSWGRFTGFWTAYWGSRRIGCRVISGGGADTKGHIQNILRLKPTVLLCTPTFALRLAAVAHEMGVDTRSTSIKLTYHAGEPGPYALPAMRKEIDDVWGAKSGDFLGIGEIDSFGGGCENRDGVHVNEMNVFSWVRDPDSGKEVGEGEVGENIVTSYANGTQPLINYHTHDLVRPRLSCSCRRTWLKFDGVVLGRSDHMVTLRGTNVYQSAVENVLADSSGVSAFYQLVLERQDTNDVMTVEFEPEQHVAQSEWQRLAESMRQRIRKGVGVRLEVRVVPPGSLPRYELKTRRVIDKRPREFRRELER